MPMHVYGNNAGCNQIISNGSYFSSDPNLLLTTLTVYIWISRKSDNIISDIKIFQKIYDAHMFKMSSSAHLDYLMKHELVKKNLNTETYEIW